MGVGLLGGHVVFHFFLAVGHGEAVISSICRVGPSHNYPLRLEGEAVDLFIVCPGLNIFVKVIFQIMLVKSAAGNQHEVYKL
jgi:hypothetical protein